MDKVFLLALTAALNPTLLTATTVMLLLPKPSRLMLGYWLGAMMTSVTLGCVIVFALSDSGAVDTTQNTISPAVEIALGALALVVAFVLGTGRHEAASRRRAERRVGKEPPKWQRTLSKGTARTTFVIGALLTLPGASYLAGLNNIHKLDYSTAETVLAIVGFNLVMLILLEGPLIAFKIAPEWTPDAIERAKAWGGRHGRKVGVWFLAVIGTLLIVKGVITALS